MVTNNEKELTEKLQEFLKDAPHNTYISREWEMKNGIYQQYSAYNDSTPCESSTINTITSF